MIIYVTIPMDVGRHHSESNRFIHIDKTAHRAHQ